MLQEHVWHHVVVILVLLITLRDYVEISAKTPQFQKHGLILLALAVYKFVLQDFFLKTRLNNVEVVA